MKTLLKSTYKRFVRAERHKVAAGVAIVYMAILMLFSLNACGQTTNATAVLFNTENFTGLPLNNPITVTALNTPYSISNNLIIGSETILYPTNGIAITNLFPGDYSVRFWGIFQPWIITVTPTTNVLNAAQIPKAGVSGQNIFLWTNALAGLTLNLTQNFYTNAPLVAAGTNIFTQTNGLLITVNGLTDTNMIRLLQTNGFNSNQFVTVSGLTSLKNGVQVTNILENGATNTSNQDIDGNLDLFGLFVFGTSGSTMSEKGNGGFVFQDTNNFSKLIVFQGGVIIGDGHGETNLNLINATNNDLVIGAATTNALTTLSNYVLLVSQNATNEALLIGLNATNEALLIGANGTNNTAALGTSITNGAIANLSNYVAAVSLNATNEALKIGLGATNNDQLLGTSITNGAVLNLSNYVLTVSQNATNEALLIGGNGTNESLLIGLNGTNNVLALSNNINGLFVLKNNGVATNLSHFQTNSLYGSGNNNLLGTGGPELRIYNNLSPTTAYQTDYLAFRWFGNIAQISEESALTNAHDFRLQSGGNIKLVSGYYLNGPFAWNLDAFAGNFSPVVADTNSILNLKNLQAFESIIGGTNYSDGTGLSNVPAAKVTGSFNPLHVGFAGPNQMLGTDSGGVNVIGYTNGPGIVFSNQAISVTGGLLNLYTNQGNLLTNLNLIQATNNDQALGAAITNGAINNLSNYVLTISQNATNEALNVGAAITNGAILNLSNYVLTVSQNATNEALKIGLNATNNDLASGAAITNGAILNLSNYIATISGNATNEALAVGANATNAFIPIVLGNGTNTDLVFPTSGGYAEYLHPYGLFSGGLGIEVTYVANDLSLVSFLWRTAGTNFTANNITVLGPATFNSYAICTNGFQGRITTGQVTNESGSRVAYQSDLLTLSGGLPNLVTNNGILLTNIPVSGIKATNNPIGRLFLSGGDGTNGGWTPAIYQPVANLYSPVGSDTTGSNIVAWSLGGGLVNVGTNMYITNMPGFEILSASIPNSAMINQGVTVTATANQTTISGGSPLNLGGTLVIGTVQNINPGATAVWNLVNSTNLLLSSLVSPTNGVQTASSIDFALPEATSNITAAVTFNSLLNFNPTNYNKARRWIVNTSGGNLTLTFNASWRSDNNRTTATTYTVTNNTILRLDVAMQMGQFTNVISEYSF